MKNNDGCGCIAFCIILALLNIIPWWLVILVGILFIIFSQ